MAIDLKVVSENLAELLTSVVNTATKFYDIFVNPEAKDVTIDVFNDENKLVKQTIPNLAKSRQPLTGYGSPEGRTIGNLGELYLDTSNASLYVKVSGENGSNIGWQQVATTGSLVGTINNVLPLENVYTLNSAGSMELIDNRSYTMSATDNFSFTLPVINSDLKLHRIHIQLSAPANSYTINLGTLLYEPCDWTLEESSGTYTLRARTPLETLHLGGTYIIDYEYNFTDSDWVVKVQRETDAW